MADKCSECGGIFGHRQGCSIAAEQLTIERGSTVVDSPRRDGLAGVDPGLPDQSGPFGGVADAAEVSEQAKREGWKTLASYSAAQTAAMLRGDDPGQATIHNAEVKANVEAQHAALRKALFSEVVPALQIALSEHSNNTAKRLSQIAAQAELGDPGATQLLGAMLGELLTWALKP